MITFHLPTAEELHSLLPTGIPIRGSNGLFPERPGAEKPPCCTCWPVCCDQHPEKSPSTIPRSIHCLLLKWMLSEEKISVWYSRSITSLARSICWTTTLPGLTPNPAHLNELMDTLEIRNLEKKLPSQLSQGELQRFAVARAFANQPAVLLADEPTSSLDDRNCDTFVRLITENAGRFNTTLVIATHDARLKQNFSSIYSL